MNSNRTEKKEFFETGELRKIGDYQNGKKIGIWVEYYRNGQICSIGRFGSSKIWLNSDENKEGEWKEYYENGHLRRIGVYEDCTKPVGEWKEYYETGQLRSIGKYKAGWYKKTGIWKYFHKNGDIKKIEEYSWSCYPTGDWTEYFEGNAIKKTEHYKSGNPIKEWVEYFQSGKVRAQANYSLKKKIKKQPGYNKYSFNVEWRTYLENGTLSTIEHYATDCFDTPFGGKGKRNGLYQKFYDNQKLECQGECSENLKKGEWQYYDRNGILIENVRTWLRSEELVQEF